MSNRRFSIFRPRLPRVSGLGDTAASSASWAKQTFSRSGATCPNEGCDGTLQILDIIPEGDKTAVVTSLACETCGRSEPVEHLIDQAAGQIDQLRSGERTFFISGLLLFLIFAGLAFMNGSFVTLFGGGVFGVLLIMRGFVFRYKAWQITNRKMFQSTPPFREWLADEFS